MRKSILAILALPVLGGCLSSAPPAPRYWLFSWHAGQPSAPAVAKPLLDATVRVSLLDVCAPYSGTRLPVLREDGSIAFDDFNAFAAPPASILRGMTPALVADTGFFARVVPSASIARTPYLLEITVGEIAFDCRKPGQRAAHVALRAVLLEDRLVKAMSSAEASVPLADGNFGVAFGKAYDQAVRTVLAGLFVK